MREQMRQQIERRMKGKMRKYTKKSMLSQEQELLQCHNRGSDECFGAIMFITEVDIDKLVHR